MDPDLLFEKGECCACRRRLKDTKTKDLIMAALPYRATWKYPAYGNVITNMKPIATAIFCQACIDNKAPAKFAIETDTDNIIYHQVEELEKA
jgi:hypothetical protein